MTGDETDGTSPATPGWQDRQRAAGAESAARRPDRDDEPARPRRIEPSRRPRPSFTTETITNASDLGPDGRVVPGRRR